MSDKTLVDRLREDADETAEAWTEADSNVCLMREAADRIEELEHAGLDYNNGLADGERGSRARIATLEEAIREWDEAQRGLYAFDGGITVPDEAYARFRMAENALRAALGPAATASTGLPDGKE